MLKKLNSLFRRDDPQLDAGRLAPRVRIFDRLPDGRRVERAVSMEQDTNGDWIAFCDRENDSKGNR